MASWTVLAHNQGLFLIAILILGLVMGSFLNVVVFRLPKMLEIRWRHDCLELLGRLPEPESGRFDLIYPPSTCPNCGQRIAPWHNIPIVSYLWLRGRSACCHSPISLRYPVIEGLTGILSLAVAWRFGFSLQTLAALVFTWNLIALSFIDLDHQLLPDAITLPMVWLGLLLSLTGAFTDPQASILGATFGYLSLWSVYQCFKLFTGKEGMGYGDFKLLAAAGAWLGWQALPSIILLSSLAGAVIGLGLTLISGRDKNIPLPFGPYLALAAWIALMWGGDLNQLYLQLSGIP
ncbi:MAG: A24 family peptidase [Methylohalobius sp.]|nr:A24 family peptidase [Methylohalobius sp.]